MSLNKMFKKSNRNFRTKKAEFDSSDESNDNNKNSSSENIEIKQDYKQSIEKEDSNSMPEVIFSKSNKSKTTTKLSFNNEEEEENEITEFKVKKSKESRRIAKELKKSKKEKEKQLKQDDFKQTKYEHENISTQIYFNEEIKIKPLNTDLTQPKLSKYLQNKYKSIDDKSEDEFDQFRKDYVKSEDESAEENEDETEKLKRLREEFEILNGEDLDPVENETDDSKRSMKIMLKSGIIPDASLIHEARKKRELARQGDYIPIGRQKNDRYYSTKSKNQQDEDEIELSDDEQNEPRISLNYREKAYKERQITRDNFLAYEQGSDDERQSNDEDEDERWEREQIKKGVLISQLSSSNIDLKDINKGKFIEKILGSNLEQEPMDIENVHKQFSLERINNLPKISFLTIKDSLKKNLNSIEETHRAHLNEYNMTLENLNANRTDLENLKNSKPLIDEQYVYYQEMKAYLTDFIDCYNEKILEIEKAEQKWTQLFKQRALNFTNRRQQDVRDQNHEITKKSIDPAHQRRLNEREARRSKRNLVRNEKKIHIKNELELIELNEGFSTDDEESQSDENIFKQKRQDIINQLNQDVYTDVLEDFYKFDLIKQRFEKWKKLNLYNYKTAFVSLSLPKLFSPLVRIDILDWNPVEQDQADYIEKTKWFNDLISFNKQDLLSNTSQDLLKIKLDDDFLLIPYIVEKIVLNKLITIAESVYEPMSSKRTKNFRNLVMKIVHDYPTLNSQSLNAKKLIETLIARFKATFDQDVFVPLYSRAIISDKTNVSSKFFFRQFWSCVKLFNNVLEWKGILSDNVIKELSLDCLLNRYLMIALQSMEPNINTISYIEYIVKKLPSEWLEKNIESTNTMNLPQITNLIRLVRRIADQINKDDYELGKINSNQFKEQIKRIRKLFLSMGASDQALSLSNAYEL